MDELRQKLLVFSESTGKSITPKELSQMYDYVFAQAMEYYVGEYVDNEYLATLLSDIREDML